MRKRLLGSIAALAAGAGAAWGQPPVEPAGGPPPGVPAGLPAAVGPGVAAPGGAAVAPPLGGPPVFGGVPSKAIPGNAGFAPPPAIMPPGNYGPPYDPLGLGPVGGFGPPPAPMYPMPGPYGAQSWQPTPDLPNVPDGSGRFGGRGGAADRLNELNYCTAPCFWFTGEELLWFTRGQKVSYPLLTTSAPSDAGMLGAASTTVLVGQRDLGYNAINGLRMTSGFFYDADRRRGFEMSGFILERAANIRRYGGFVPGNGQGNPSATISDAGIPTLARPFIDVDGTPGTVVLSGPDFGAAQVEVGTNTQTWGIDAVGVWNLYRAEPESRFAWSMDFIAGYRFLQVKEELWIHSRTQLDDRTALPIFVTGPFGVITQAPAAVAPATTTFGGVTVGGPAIIEIRDQFRATNQFHGFLLGLRGEARYGMWTTSAYAKAAIGNMHERIEVFGGGAFYDRTGRSGTAAGTTGGFNLGVGGGVGSAVGGVLANAGNIGTFVQDRFTVVPEAGISVGIALTRRLNAFVGGSVLYFPHVVRPGDLANPVVSSAAIPFSGNYGAAGAARGPGVRINQTELWIGGVQWGLNFRY